MKCLIELGTDLTQRDSSGYSALLIASLKVAFHRTHPKYEADFINFRKCLSDKKFRAQNFSKKFSKFLKKVSKNFFSSQRNFWPSAFLGKRAVRASALRCG